MLAGPAAALEPRDRGERFEPGSPALGVREPTRAVAAKSPDRIILEIEKKYDGKVTYAAGFEPPDTSTAEEETTSGE